MDVTFVWKSFQLGIKKNTKIPALLTGSYHVAFIQRLNWLHLCKLLQLAFLPFLGSLFLAHEY